ncbi:hypothetical protein Moror_2921 [Moniliophthora roreri MCA 2997]|uniref:Uncharacterized protein n=1 Tax=Moniliophthora roreri (strain MCA 2997) TaxID=1381753 RepID=V2XEG5_MONRO|nr:hypothetical protein Moror_2921 [Moniliophthora roreri MCA 2997]
MSTPSFVPALPPQHTAIVGELERLLEPDARLISIPENSPRILEFTKTICALAIDINNNHGGANKLAQQVCEIVYLVAYGVEDHVRNITDPNPRTQRSQAIKVGKGQNLLKLLGDIKKSVQPRFLGRLRDCFTIGDYPRKLDEAIQPLNPPNSLSGLGCAILLRLGAQRDTLQGP